MATDPRAIDRLDSAASRGRLGIAAREPSREALDGHRAAHGRSAAFGGIDGLLGWRLGVGLAAAPELFGPGHASSALKPWRHEG